MRYYLVDVFAQEKYSGNQLAVITEAASLSAKQMQQIANEMHFSETAFLLSSEKRSGGFEVRIFTTFIEIPFAGHPTLGTAYIIKHFIAGSDDEVVVLNLKAGKIPVHFEKQGNQEVLWMKQLQPSFGKIFEIGQLAKVLQLNESDFDSTYPIQKVSTGLPFIIVL